MMDPEVHYEWKGSAMRAVMNSFFPNSQITRRTALCRAGACFGSVALMSLLAGDGVLQAAEAQGAVSPLAPKPPRFAPRARAVIQLFMHGGPSHVDTLDPKPDLMSHDGHAPPAEFHK